MPDEGGEEEQRERAADQHEFADRILGDQPLPAALLSANRKVATSMKPMPASAAERPAEAEEVDETVVMAVPAGTWKLELAAMRRNPADCRARA